MMVHRFVICDVLRIDFVLHMEDSVLINPDVIVCVTEIWTYVIMTASQLDLASHTTVKIFKQGN